MPQGTPLFLCGVHGQKAFYPEMRSCCGPSATQIFCSNRHNLSRSVRSDKPQICCHMTNPSFSHEQPLPSLRVTKELLKSLEKYLVKRVVDAAILTEEEAKLALSIRIEDSLGTEKIISIDQMTPSRFADSTSRVEIEIDSPYRRDGIRLRVRLNFAKGRLFSTLAISATMPNAREVALGLRDGLLRVLEPQRTWHWIVHPSAQWWGCVMGVSLWVGYYLFSTDGKEPYYPILLAIFAFVWFYLFGFGTLRPYTTFESRASDRSDKIWSWFLGGAGTFLLFGTALTFLRRPLLGF